MLNIIKSYLNDIKRTEDGFYIGFIDTADMYKQFLSALKEAGFYFSVRDSETFKEDGQFLFKCNKSNVPVPFSGFPFRREKNITYQCAYGSQYYGKAKKNDFGQQDQHSGERKRLRIRHSKKLGCKAKMAAKCIRIYHDYKIDSENAHWRLKKEVIKSLKRDLFSEECEVKSLSRYFVKISEAEQHCHSPMHPKSTLKKKKMMEIKSDLCLCETDDDNDYIEENELEFSESNIADLPCDIAFEDISDMAMREESDSLREQCRKKNKEIMTLSYLCHDEDQLKDLLFELTRVTDKFNENVSQSAETINVQNEDLQIIGNEVCLTDDVAQTVVIDKGMCLEVEESKTVIVDNNSCLELCKDINVDCQKQKTYVVRKDVKKRIHKENEKPYVRTLNSKKMQRVVSVNQAEETDKQKKEVYVNMSETPSNIEVMQTNGISDNGLNYVYLIY